MDYYDITTPSAIDPLRPHGRHVFEVRWQGARDVKLRRFSRYADALAFAERMQRGLGKSCAVYGTSTNWHEMVDLTDEGQVEP